MRQFAILVAFIGITQGAAAQSCKQPFEATVGYQLSIPMGSMTPHMAPVHAFRLNWLYSIPATRGLFAVGAELTTGTYASFTETRNFGSGSSVAPMDVRYTSSVTMGSLLGRINFLQTESVEAFVGMKGGIAYFSSDVQIEHSSNSGGCSPVDTKSLLNDATWQAGAYGGANIDLNVFHNGIPANRTYLQVHIGATRGGRVDYINVKNRQSASAVQSGGTSNSGSDGRSLEMRFVDMQTGQQHSHEVARVYNDPVRFMDAGVGVVFKF
jgi:hypothetical protein